jgi:hypothetical protein
MEGYERKNKEEIHKELQDLDPIGSPHIEEILIGGNIDLDLLSPFPQKDIRNMGGKEEGGQAFKINNGGERSPKMWLAQGGRRGVYRWGKTGSWKQFATKFGRKFSAVRRSPKSSRVVRFGVQPDFSGLGPDFPAWSPARPDLGPNFPLRKNINTKMVITFASGLHFR